MIMQMMMSHDEPGSKHQITVKKKRRKVRWMIMHLEIKKIGQICNWGQKKNIQHLILFFVVIFFIYCWKQSAPPILTAQRRIGMWMTALLHINADWEFTCAKRLVLHTYIHNSCTWLYIYVSLSHWYYVGLQEWAIENFFVLL